jgi:hypothetical protein
MATSGVRTFILTLDDIVRKAYKKVGVPNPTGGQFDDARVTLNIIVNALQNTGTYLWTQENEILALTADSPYVALDSTVIDVPINTMFYRSNGVDYRMTPFSRENYAQETSKLTVGIPSRYYIDWQLTGGLIYYWPVVENSTSHVLGTDGNTYICLADHTSATATNKPITGSAYTTYWELTTLITSTNVWANATAYYSNRLHLTQVLRIQDFVDTSDNPDATVRWYNAFICGLASELSVDIGLPQWERNDLAMRAQAALMSARAGGRESSDLRIMPRLR